LHCLTFTCKSGLSPPAYPSIKRSVGYSRPQCKASHVNYEMRGGLGKLIPRTPSTVSEAITSAQLMTQPPTNPTIAMVRAPHIAIEQAAVP
jgi:hypothetical protein